MTVILMVSLLGCSGEDNADSLGCSKQLTATSSGTEVTLKEADDTFIKAYNSYAFSLFRECYKAEQGTMMISPYSIYMALGLLANGADGETLTQLENALGGLSVDEMNSYAGKWSQTLCEQSDSTKFSDANSIWLNQAYEKGISEAYLRACGDYFRASVFSSDFSDAKTVAGDMNKWVKKHTNEMIPELIKPDAIDMDTIAVLMNAIAFDGKWDEAFEDSDVWEDDFTHADGSVTTMEMMHESDKMFYYEDDLCSGFSKDYKDGRYSFRAFLPKEGVSVDELAEHMTEENYAKLLDDRLFTKVIIEIPEYTEEYELENMCDSLESLGIVDAFLPGADFSGMSEEISIYVSKVIHKTKIELNTEGTKAAAATAVIMTKSAALVEPEEPKTVYLNSPFLYMIADNETDCPVFIGVYQ